MLYYVSFYVFKDICIFSSDIVRQLKTFFPFKNRKQEIFSMQFIASPLFPRENEILKSFFFNFFSFNISSWNVSMFFNLQIFFLITVWMFRDLISESKDEKNFCFFFGKFTAGTFYWSIPEDSCNLGSIPMINVRDRIFFFNIFWNFCRKKNVF